jgi:glycosyltransferase 2 family protein
LLTNRLSKKLAPVLKYAVGGIALYMLIRHGVLDPNRVWQALHHAPIPLMTALFLYLGVNVCASLRWWLLLRSAQVHESSWRVFRLHMVGVFFSALLPGGTAGDLAKGFFLFRKDDAQTSARAIASLFMDRITGMLGLIALALLAGWSQFDQWRSIAALRAIETVLILVFLAMLGVLAIALRPETAVLRPIFTLLQKLPGGGFLAEAARSLAIYRGQYGVLWVAFGLSMAAHSLLVSVYIACAWALGLHLDWTSHFVAAPLCTVLNGLPIAPAGLGVGEAFGQWLYRQLGVGQGGELLALVHVCVFATAAACSTAYVFEKRR